MAGKGTNTRAKSNLKTGRDYSYDKAYAATKKRKKYRAELNKINRKKGKVGDGKDVSHTKGGGTVLESQSRNRARNGSGSNSRLK
ncbi:MAG: hypothetical protein ACP5N7_04220 [Candidatus Pacearchaeota archaeon]